ncbi:unnamed protein product [Schistosoma curassoni]|uniref:Uncharacterized protein n=1 Tax=Schistosoma curassoni TaxID=6186 RepID=A0A183KPC0_9TREM|nr:unnamed protein product [Schistosoma curassoni]
MYVCVTESQIRIISKLSILASAKAHNYIRNSKSNFSQLISIQHIGCGIIPDHILKILTVLEKKFQMGLIPIWTLLNNTNFTRFEMFKNITIFIHLLTYLHTYLLTLVTPNGA